MVPLRSLTLLRSSPVEMSTFCRSHHAQPCKGLPCPSLLLCLQFAAHLQPALAFQPWSFEAFPRNVGAPCCTSGGEAEKYRSVLPRTIRIVPSVVPAIMYGGGKQYVINKKRESLKGWTSKQRVFGEELETCRVALQQCLSWQVSDRVQGPRCVCVRRVRRCGG